MSPEELQDIEKKNKRIALVVLLVVAGMIGLSFASVPLYNLFCRVTGYGGTTQVSNAGPDTILDRRVLVKFTTNVASDLDWAFEPDMKEVSVQLGQMALMSYNVQNFSSEPVVGTAVYNVSPPKAGKYFNKTQCFCFGEQVVGAGQKVNMPVVFYVDPKMVEDRSMDDVSVITLSYTYYKADSDALESAMDVFYQEEDDRVYGTFDDYLRDRGLLK